MRVLYLDCACGISGDMTVGALIDAGADFDLIQKALASLQVPGFRVEAEKITKHAIRATQFRVIEEEDAPRPHRHLRHIVEIIQQGALPDAVKAAAIDTFTRVAEAEAEVHGTTKEKVHFHEVGAIDSIADIVAAEYALHLLQVDKVYASPLHVGAGTVECDHGVMSVPAPATARLLLGKPTYGGEVPYELVTPTGAALVSRWVQDFGAQPTMTVQQIGYGSGTRDLSDRANVLRVCLGELAESSTALSLEKEEVRIIETNIDDMNPELFPVLLDRLMTAGARDAFLTPVLGKKGRPAQLVTALCAPEKEAGVIRVLFQETGTLGVRFRTESRYVLPREVVSVETPWGAVRVKSGVFEGTTTCLAPEFEDCRSLAEQAGVAVKQVYETALTLAMRKE